MKPKEGYRMMRRLFSKRTYIVLGILCFIFVWLQFGIESYAFTRTTGEVTGSSVKVRKEASTESEVVASVRAGDDLDVTDAVNGTDGKVWYKIIVSANEYGYIRSDFVTLASGEQTPSTNTTTDTTTNTTTDNTTDTTDTSETTEITPMDTQKGHTNTNNVKVRKAATTNSDEVDRLSQDQIFNITGTSEGPDGKMWYYVSYIDGGASKKGFIRSDLVTIMEEEQEEEPDDTTGETTDEVIKVEDEDTSKPNIPAPTTNYEAVYTTDENGDYVWYLYDRTAGQRYKVEQLLQVSKQQQEEMDDLSSANFGLKIGLIITICLLVMVAVAIAFYILKQREEEENTAYRRPSQAQGGMGNRNQSTSRSSNGATRTQSGMGNTSASRTQSADRTQNGVRPQTLAKPQTTAKTANVTAQGTKIQNSTASQKPVNAQAKSPQSQQQKISWKAKNFLDDNDELEFGFLDFDEDDE